MCRNQGLNKLNTAGSVPNAASAACTFGVEVMTLAGGSMWRRTSAAWMASGIHFVAEHERGEVGRERRLGRVGGEHRLMHGLALGGRLLDVLVPQADERRVGAEGVSSRSSWLSLMCVPSTMAAYGDVAWQAVSTGPRVAKAATATSQRGLTAAEA